MTQRKRKRKQPRWRTCTHVGGGRIDGRALARGAVAPSHCSHCTALGVISLQQGCPLLCLDSLKKRDTNTNTNTILADPSLHCTALRHAEHSPTVTRPATLLLPPPQLPTTSILTPVFRLDDTDDTHTTPCRKTATFPSRGLRASPRVPAPTNGWSRPSSASICPRPT